MDNLCGDKGDMQRALVSLWALCHPSGSDTHTHTHSDKDTCSHLWRVYIARQATMSLASSWLPPVQNSGSTHINTSFSYSDSIVSITNWMAGSAAFRALIIVSSTWHTDPGWSDSTQSLPTPAYYSLYIGYKGQPTWRFDTCLGHSLRCLSRRLKRSWGIFF